MTTENENQMADALRAAFTTTDDRGDAANVADGLLAVAGAVNRLADATQRLGNGSAATDIGAIEGLSMQVRDGLNGIAESIESSTR